MATSADYVIAGSSMALRIACFIFLRWIPSPAIRPYMYTFLLIYIPSFLAKFAIQEPYTVEDQDGITVTETELDDQPPKYASTAAHFHNTRSHDKRGRLGKDGEMDGSLRLQQKSAHPWTILLLGLPSPSYALLSAFTFLTNVVLVLAVMDLTYRANLLYPRMDLSFVRIGYVSPTEVNLLIREPCSAQWPVYVSFRLAAPPAADEDAAWQPAGTVRSFANETDYTAAVKISLPSHAERSYQWITSNNHTGFFTTPPKVGHVSKDGLFTFLTSSCILPHFPYNPFDHALAIPGLRHLANIIKSLPGGAHFMLFVGDFIYVDVPDRFGTQAEDYRREYRQVYSSPDWPLVGQNLSWIHVLDDHEIANDWDEGTTGVYNAAVDPWHHYHTSVNPPKARQAGTYNTQRKEATYFEFSQGPAAFFMLDTRTYRDKAHETSANATGKTMLGADQLADLLAFLRKPEGRGVNWKIIVSSIPFTKNWRVNSFDTWAGYLQERQIILEAMWDVGLQGGVGVVVLSGDRHEFAATAFPPPADSRWPISATVNEYSTGPLSQFYLPIHTYRQTDEEDMMVKYIPAGNSKVGAVTIENTVSDQSILRFRLYVDGVAAWSNVLLSPPIASKKHTQDALWG